jgi:hypothetical protein
MAAMSLHSHRHQSSNATSTPRRGRRTVVRGAAVALTGVTVAAGIGVSAATAEPAQPAPAAPQISTKVADLSHIAGVALAAGVSPETVAHLTANPDATYGAALAYGVPAGTIDWVIANPEAALGAAQGAGIDVVWAANTLAAQV